MKITCVIAAVLVSVVLSTRFHYSFGPKKLLQRVSQQYYWPGMKGDAYQVLKSCV